MSALRWTDGDIPQIDPAEQAGMKDFLTAYEAHYDEIYAVLMKSVEGLPGLAAMMANMPRAQQEEQNKLSMALMRTAILENNWKPLLDNQRMQGAVYARAGIRFREWFDLVSDFQKVLVPYLVKSHGQAPARLSTAIQGMNRYVDVAMSTIAEEYLQIQEGRIEQQALAIQELSTPVLQVLDRLLLLPIIGMLDTERARLLTESLLRGIRAHRARVVVMDITGVSAVDSKVANHLLQTVAAAKLMGATVVVTGLSAEVAQALVTLGVDLHTLNTVGDLQGGLEEARRMLGYKVVTLDGKAPPPGVV